MITGEASKDRVATAVEAGVTSFIVKPFSFEALRKRMVAVLGEF
jgi:DNA-binding response OmpR family regulator